MNTERHKDPISTVRGELTLRLSTGRNRDEPVAAIETLNLVLEPTEAFGGGRLPPSICLPGGSESRLAIDERGAFRAEFEVDIDVPAARDLDAGRKDPTAAPGKVSVPTEAVLEGRFLRELSPRKGGQETAEGTLAIRVPPVIADEADTPSVVIIRLIFAFLWLFARPRRQLCLQPVFISATAEVPATGSAFYPLLARANEIWSKCCIQFSAKCPPIYLDDQDFRVLTVAEATDINDEVVVDDAIEVFVVERFDPVDTYGGGATWGSGTAAARIVTGDNQLPGNENHLAHELGHVLGLGHPDDPNGLIAGCSGSVLEPSGFFADNPEFQCRDNCTSASNPLLCTLPHESCFFGAPLGGSDLF